MALATTGQRFLLNSLSVAEINVPTYVQRLSGSAIAGGEFEECFMTGLWSSEEDAQLQAIALLKREGKPGGAGFWCYADNTNAVGASSIAKRMYIYASFLLTYDPNYSVFEESFTTPSTFKVFPETGFVPMSPATTPTRVSSLATSMGAYMREYDASYYREQFNRKVRSRRPIQARRPRWVWPTLGACTTVWCCAAVVCLTAARPPSAAPRLRRWVPNQA